MDLDEAIRFAHADGCGPSAGQQALGLLVAELYAARTEIERLQAALETILRAARVDGDSAGVTTRLAIRQARGSFPALGALLPAGTELEIEYSEHVCDEYCQVCEERPGL